MGTPTVTAQMRGETMAYAVQSAVHNLAANLYEPYINYRVQKYYSGVHGNYSQNLLGEFAGDIIGASSLMAAEAVIPEHLHLCSRTIRGWVDPLYTSVAHRVFAREKDAPDYEEKVEKWKTFQERNLVRAAIVGTTGIAGNLATQKMLGNPSPTKLIFVGKLISTSVTTMLGLGARMMFPDKIEGVDQWMSKKIFAPLLTDKGTPDAASAPSHAEKIAYRSNENLSVAR